MTKKQQFPLCEQVLCGWEGGKWDVFFILFDT